MIPKIIHMIWIQGGPPERFNENIASWKTHNPDHQIKMWSEESFFNEHKQDVDADNMYALPTSLLEIYNKEPQYAMKSTLIRIYALRKYGGIYTDLDIKAIKPISEVLPNMTTMTISRSMTRSYIINLVYCNSDEFFIASPQDVALWNDIINMALEYDTNNKLHPFSSALMDAYNKISIRNKYDIKILNSDNIVLSDRFITKDTFAVHYCETAWSGENFQQNFGIWVRNSEYMDLLIVLIIVVLIVVVTVVTVVVIKKGRLMVN
jgi:mannosyltransferase OCH1-like enzyme